MEIALVVGLILYFIPTIVAGIREKQNGMAITMLNLFLGWTFIGWVVALVWALTVDQPTQSQVRSDNPDVRRPGIV